MNTLKHKVLPLRERASIIHHILQKRLDTLLSELMRETGFDMWLIIGQEDNHDPVFKTMMPVNIHTPKVLQMLVFFDRGATGVERINLSRTKAGDLYDMPYTVRLPDQQWVWLKEVIEERNPKRIGINQAEVAWAADGLTATLKDKLFSILDPQYIVRLESAEVLGRRWLETMIAEELELYHHVVSVAHTALREIYSPRMIIPGVTTPDDLVWAFWQLTSDMGIAYEYRSAFRLVRGPENRSKYGVDDNVIRHGDLVYCDAVTNYLRLITDTKQWVYILRPGEHDVPDSMKHIMQDGNRLQDIYTGEFIQGRTGNEILRATLDKARQTDLLNPKVYSHSCGHLIHEPGPLIGHPLEQENWPGRGDVPLNYNTTFTCELSVDGIVPEWNNEKITFPQEEQIMFTRDGVQFLDGRQTEFYVI